MPPVTPARSGSPWTIRYIAEVRDAPGPVLNGGIPHAAKASTLPKEKNIARRAGRLPFHLLGRHEAGRPDDRPGRGQPGAGDRARDAEVDDPRPVHGNDPIE